MEFSSGMKDLLAKYALIDAFMKEIVVSNKKPIYTAGTFRQRLINIISESGGFDSNSTELAFSILSALTQKGFLEKYEKTIGHFGRAYLLSPIGESLVIYALENKKNFEKFLKTKLL